MLVTYRTRYLSLQSPFSLPLDTYLVYLRVNQGNIFDKRMVLFRVSQLRTH